MCMKTISFCIPWHDTGKGQRRTDIFNYLKDYYEKEIVPQYEGAELIVAGDDSLEEGLNRSRMRNNCAKQASGDILFFIDADCYLSKESIDKALALLEDNVGLVQYTRVSWISDINTKKILYEHDDTLLSTGRNENTLWGLVFIITKDNYIKMNGFSEQFKRWSWEDPAFIDACTTLCGPLIKVPINYPAIHLEHPRSEEHSHQSESFKHNEKLYRRYQRAKGNINKMRLLQGLPAIPVPKEIIGDQKADVLATEEQYIVHLLPVYVELLSRARAGYIFVPPTLYRFAHRLLKENNVDVNYLVTYSNDRELCATMVKRSGPVLVSSMGDYNVALAWNRPLVLFEHGAGQTYGGRGVSFVGGVGRERASLIVVPRENLVELSMKKYPRIAHSAAGCPKLDWYINKPHGDAVCISFHWHSTFCPEADYSFPEYRSSIAELKKFCDRRHIELIGHCHPRARAEIKPFIQGLGIRFVDDFSDVCHESQIYICDNSSTIFEFAALGRPVVILNSKFYRKNVNYGLRFWDNVDCGVVVDEPKKLVDIVGKILDNEVEIDPDAIKRVYNNIGSASKVAADSILNTLACWQKPVCVKGDCHKRVEVVFQQGAMFRGNRVSRGDIVTVDEVEALRLERRFNRGVATAVRTENNGDSDNVVFSTKNNIVTIERENPNMIKMRTMREMMFQGKLIPAGSDITVNESEATRLERYFYRGVASASRVDSTPFVAGPTETSEPVTLTIESPTEQRTLVPKDKDKLPKGLERAEFIPHDKAFDNLAGIPVLDMGADSSVTIKKATTTRPKRGKAGK